MGNVCCADDIRKDANGKTSGEVDGNTMKIKRFNTGTNITAESVEASPSDSASFGTRNFKIDENYFQLSPAVKALLVKHGLFFWEESNQEIINFSGYKVFRVQRGDYSYEGQFQNNKRNGKGILLKKSKDLWVCPFIDDQPSGTGAIYYDSGDYFLGKIYKGNTIEGTMHYTDGSFYTGQFMTDGYRDGKGTLHEVGGARYEGSWKNNLKDGPGHYIIPEVWNQGVRSDQLGGGNAIQFSSTSGALTSQNNPSDKY